MYLSHISDGGLAVSGGSVCSVSAPRTEMHASVKLVGAAQVTKLCS